MKDFNKEALDVAIEALRGIVEAASHEGSGMPDRNDDILSDIRAIARNALLEIKKVRVD